MLRGSSKMPSSPMENINIQVAESSTSNLEGHMSQERRRRRRQSIFPVSLMNASSLTRLDPNLAKGIEYERVQDNTNYIIQLEEMSTRRRIQAIQNLPICLKEKRELRNRVHKMERKVSESDAGKMKWVVDCLYTTDLHFSQLKEVLSEVYQKVELWQMTLKLIGGKFGTGVLSYFIFLKWLLIFNIVSFFINFSFIIFPQLLQMKPNNISFTGMDLLTWDGYFHGTVLYYGYYTNSTITTDIRLGSYNMQLAYLLTIGIYSLTCFFVLVYSMTKSFNEHFIHPTLYYGKNAKLICAWNFSLTNEKAVKRNQANLRNQIKEALSEMNQENVKLSINQRIVRLLIHLGAWTVSMGTTAICCSTVHYISLLQILTEKNITESEIHHEPSTLILPVAVCTINLIIPVFYSFFGLVETFQNPRNQIYALLIRNVVLKMSVTAVLLYYWLETIGETTVECWNSVVGEDVSRLVLMDFIFCLLGTFFGEYLRRIIGNRFIKKLRKPEFDIARNVLDLIYAQTLLWIGIFFSPLLPLFQIVKLIIIFYVKKDSLMRNCVPPRKAWRAGQMTTIFICLLFFPSFTGGICMTGITIWRRKSSTTCGPYRNVDHPFRAIHNWIERISKANPSNWVVWIYTNVIKNVLFYYIIMLIVLIITYLYWEIIQGRIIKARILETYIINEGKDKMYLLDKLRKLQKVHEVADKSHLEKHTKSGRKSH